MNPKTSIIWNESAEIAAPVTAPQKLAMMYVPINMNAFFIYAMPNESFDPRRACEPSRSKSWFACPWFSSVPIWGLFA